MIRILAAVFLLFGGITAANADSEFSDHTENTLMHIMAHELGHALIREFDLPVLGNEEVLADAFATVFLHDRMPEQAPNILAARVASWQIEDDQETIFSEHPDDMRRAGQAACLLFGLSPEDNQDWVQSLGMTIREASACTDSAPEIARGWRRALGDLQMPRTAKVTEVQTLFGDGPWKDAAMNSWAIGQMRQMLESFDWHSQITLHFDHCEGGAQWSRSKRRILICDDLIVRLESQAGQ